MKTVDFNDLSKVLSGIEQKIEDCSKATADIRSRDSEINSYKELKKGNMVLMYAGVIDTYTEIGFMLSNVSETLMDMRTLRKQISALKNCPASLEQQVRARIEFMVKDLEDMRTSLSTLKDVYDAKIRFYNSCQYMLNGSKLVDRY